MSEILTSIWLGTKLELLFIDIIRASLVNSIRVKAIEEADKVYNCQLNKIQQWTDLLEENTEI